MPRWMRWILLLPLCALAIVTSAHAAGVVLVAEDGGYDVPTVQAIRTIASTELRSRGIELKDDARHHVAMPLTEDALQGIAGIGAERLFVLRIGRLGTKALFTLEELRAPDATPLFTATLTAENIEEADTVVPRLVRAVLDRVPPASTASISTVTAQESRSFRKKPGEGMLVLGLGMAPLGGSIGWNHEAEDWRVGAVFQWAEDDPSFLGMEGAWLPLQGETSPYFGLGIGVVYPRRGGEKKLGSRLDLGLEFFRLHGIRVLVGGSAVIPFASPPGTDDINPQAWLRFGL